MIYTYIYVCRYWQLCVTADGQSEAVSSAGHAPDLLVARFNSNMCVNIGSGTSVKPELASGSQYMAEGMPLIG